LVRPDRISSPITKMPAVTISLMVSSLTLLRPTLSAQRLEVTGFCRRNKHPSAGFSGSAADHP
jgi:hypothetical protein